MVGSFLPWASAFLMHWTMNFFQTGAVPYTLLGPQGLPQDMTPDSFSVDIC